MYPNLQHYVPCILRQLLGEQYFFLFVYFEYFVVSHTHYRFFYPLNGSLGVNATQGSYREISSERIHYNDQGDWASNMSPDLAKRVSEWHNTLWFDIGLYEAEGYPSE